MTKKVEKGLSRIFVEKLQITGIYKIFPPKFVISHQNTLVENCDNVFTENFDSVNGA